MCGTLNKRCVRLSRARLDRELYFVGCILKGCALHRHRFCDFLVTYSAVEKEIPLDKLCWYLFHRNLRSIDPVTLLLQYADMGRTGELTSRRAVGGSNHVTLTTLCPKEG